MSANDQMPEGSSPFATPPSYLKDVYKKYQLIRDAELEHDQSVADFGLDAPSHVRQGWREVGSISSSRLEEVCDDFDRVDGFLAVDNDELGQSREIYPVYESTALPGLRIYPSLIPRRTQLQLLSRLLHRDLSNPYHKTNAHLHYYLWSPKYYSIDESIAVRGGVPGPCDTAALSNSYFNYGPSSSTSFSAIDRTLHSPLPASRLITKKLRWITLGGQYDWTRKAYPEGKPPLFPRDIAALLRGLFPDMNAQAAIVNLYSPGDALSLHRDVSEQSKNDLISLSLGCDGIFVVGPNTDADSGNPYSASDQEHNGEEYTVLRLHSGDVLCMSGASRFAWHGVPKVVAGTCPDWMKDWPAQQRSATDDASSSKTPDFVEWRGWMATKRINLNVRQMFD